MKYIFSLLITIGLLSCNSDQNKKVTAKQDYDLFLDSSNIKTTSKFYELWNNKIKPDSMQLLSFGNVASEYNRYFKNTGEIEYLKKAEKSLKKAVDIAAIGKAGYCRALARNYISQHRFKDALVMAKEAEKMGSGVKENNELFFDVYMELGHYTKARKVLDDLDDPNDFGYLIRLAKWNDYKGDLNKTIAYMKKAKSIAETAKDNNLMIWSYTNLADYYGHAGKLEDSYRHYLMALELEPSNAYAKKGIAWIVFSHERNPKEALRILNSITNYYQSPDYYLLKAEIGAYMNDQLLVSKNLDAFVKAVNDPNYGNMYNAHNVELYLNHSQQYNMAMQLAKKEIQNRETPETYILLASSYFKMGDLDKAIEIINQEIEGKTFEPNILLQCAKIYKSIGDNGKVIKLKKELNDAIYELGPNVEKEITQL